MPDFRSYINYVLFISYKYFIIYLTVLLYSRKSLSRAVYAIRYGLPHHGVSGYNPRHQKRHLDRWRRMDREGAPQRIWKRHQWRHRDQSKDKKIPRVRRVLQRVRGWNCWKIIILFLAVTSPKLSSQSIKSYSNCAIIITHDWFSSTFDVQFQVHDARNLWFYM